MKNITLITFLLLIVDGCLGQEPNWSFNPNNYQHSMTFTTFLNIDGRTLSATNDKVAAFIDGEVRGVANVTYVESRDKYVAFLTVLSNSNNKPINFKVYDSTNEAVIEIDKTINFLIDENVGGIFQSFAIANPALNNEAEITSFSFKDIEETSINISENKIDIIVPSTTNISNLIAEFTLSNGAKAFISKVFQESGISEQDYTSPVIINVLSQDESVLKEYLINVHKETVTEALTVNLTSSTNALINTNSAEIELITNEDIDVVNATNFELKNAVIQSIVKVDETTYNIKLIALNQGLFSIQVLENTFLQSNNKENDASNELDFTLDSKSPYLISIQRKLPVNEITNADNLEFTVVFSEAVDNVSAQSFTSIADAEITITKETPTTFTVKISNIENYNGSVSVSINADNNITDIARNSLRISSLKSY